MITIAQVIQYLESMAPPGLQEPYDNAGLLTGQAQWNCTGIVCCLDATEAVVAEALQKNCNLIVAHHPVIFSGLKKINGNNYVERTIITAIKNDMALYAIHTNLDNVLHGVNGMIASRLQLQHLSILQPKSSQLKKLYFFVPSRHASEVTQALFAAGGGHIGNYSECSFSVAGEGTFKPNENANPYTGQKGERHKAEELKIEIIFPAWKEKALIRALQNTHPYEEVAYEIIRLDNEHPHTGSGIVGTLPKAVAELKLLQQLKEVFNLQVIKHTALTGKRVQKVAICGGAGSFLLKNAISAGADAYITSDVKYHEYFDADGQLLLADIGHYESEQFTIDLLAKFLEEKFPTFAVLKTRINTNPVHYY